MTWWRWNQTWKATWSRTCSALPVLACLIRETLREEEADSWWPRKRPQSLEDLGYLAFSKGRIDHALVQGTITET